MALRFPGSLDAAGFLRRYWQREPLYLPAAIEQPDLLSAEGLAGLACEDGIEARLVHSPPHPWHLQHGPLREQDFAGLADAGWSLLVQDVDKFIPAVAGLLNQFDFLPRWRIDDVMVSYAAPGGTVGPHTDDYDVFLVQGSGSRVWEIGDSGGEYLPDLPLRVLRKFERRQSWTLKPGDVLYLPPNLAHYGWSDAASMTCSVGFRAPSVAELLLSQAEYKAARSPGRYRDAGLAPKEANHGLISKAAVKRALAQLPPAGEEPEDAITWFGSLVTENKPWLQPEMPETVIAAADFASRLARGSQLRKHPAVRMARAEFPGNGLLFADGTCYPLKAGCRSLAGAICGDQAVASTDENGLILLHRLYSDGKLYWTDDE